MLSPPLDYLRRALKLAGAEELDGAAQVLLEGIELCEREPRYVNTLPRLTVNLAHFYKRQGRLAAAIEAVRRSLRFCQDDRSLLHLLADLLLEVGDVNGAAQAAFELRAACERDPAGFTSDWAEALRLLENRIIPETDKDIETRDGRMPS